MQDNSLAIANDEFEYVSFKRRAWWNFYTMIGKDKVKQVKPVRRNIGTKSLEETEIICFNDIIQEVLWK